MEQLQSKTFTGVLFGIGLAAVAVMIFQAGIWIGYKKASFSFRQGDNYYRTIGGMGGQFAPGLPHGDFTGAHGSAGRIVEISLPTFIIEDMDGSEKVVLVKDDTAIRRFHEDIGPEELQPDDFAVVIGSPDEQSRIGARLIRLLPPPPQEIGPVLFR